MSLPKHPTLNQNFQAVLHILLLEQGIVLALATCMREDMFHHYILRLHTEERPSYKFCTVPVLMIMLQVEHKYTSIWRLKFHNIQFALIFIKNIPCSAF